MDAGQIFMMQMPIMNGQAGSTTPVPQTDSTVSGQFAGLFESIAAAEAGSKTAVGGEETRKVAVPTDVSQPGKGEEILQLVRLLTATEESLTTGHAESGKSAKGAGQPENSTDDVTTGAVPVDTPVLVQGSLIVAPPVLQMQVKEPEVVEAAQRTQEVTLEVPKLPVLNSLKLQEMTATAPESTVPELQSVPKTEEMTALRVVVQGQKELSLAPETGRKQEILKPEAETTATMFVSNGRPIMTRPQKEVPVASLVEQSVVGKTFRSYVSTETAEAALVPRQSVSGEPVVAASTRTDVQAVVKPAGVELSPQAAALQQSVSVEPLVSAPVRTDIRTVVMPKAVELSPQTSASDPQQSVSVEPVVATPVQNDVQSAKPTVVELSSQAVAVPTQQQTVFVEPAVAVPKRTDVQSAKPTVVELSPQAVAPAPLQLVSDEPAVAAPVRAEAVVTTTGEAVAPPRQQQVSASPDDRRQVTASLVDRGAVPVLALVQETPVAVEMFLSVGDGLPVEPSGNVPRIRNAGFTHAVSAGTALAAQQSIVKSAEKGVDSTPLQASLAVSMVAAGEPTEGFSSEGRGESDGSARQQGQELLKAAPVNLSFPGHQQPVRTEVAEIPPQNQTPADQGHIVRQVKEQLAGHELKTGAEQITLRLSPEHLGDLKLNFRMEDQRLKVEIVAENRMVRDALLQNSDSLKESLARQNIKMDSFDVTTGSNGGQQGQGRGDWRELAEQGRFRAWNQSGSYLKGVPEPVAAPLAYLAKSEHTMVDLHF